MRPMEGGEAERREKRGRGCRRCLQQHAAALLLALLAAAGLAGLLADDARQSLVEDVLETLAGEGRALEVLEGTELLDHVVGLLVGDGRLAVLAEGLEGRLVVAEISLGADEDDGDVGAMVLDLEDEEVVVSRASRAEQAGESGILAGWLGVSRERIHTSTYQRSLTLTNEGWLTTEKQSKKMSVFGYERVRMRA